MNKLGSSSGLAMRMYTVHSCDFPSSARFPSQYAHDPTTKALENEEGAPSTAITSTRTVSLGTFTVRYFRTVQTTYFTQYEYFFSHQVNSLQKNDRTEEAIHNTPTSDHFLQGIGTATKKKSRRATKGKPESTRDPKNYSTLYAVRSNPVKPVRKHYIPVVLTEL